MNDDVAIEFYPGKAQLIPVAFNIAVAPVLLYLLRLWPWPPTTLHLGVFFITTIMAFRFVKSRLARPKLVFDSNGIHFGKSFAAADIRGVKPYMRALKVWVEKDNKVSEKVINLWWASKEDMQAIFTLASQRYKLMD